MNRDERLARLAVAEQALNAAQRAYVEVLEAVSDDVTMAEQLDYLAEARVDAADVAALRVAQLITSGDLHIRTQESVLGEFVEVFAPPALSIAAIKLYER